jgi:hypothetical protein
MIMKKRISPKLKIGQMIIILFFVLATLGRPDHVSYGQESESKWSEPQPLSSATAYSWFPDIAVDAYGNIHVVWASGSVGYDAVLYTTSKTGSFWSAPNDIFALPQNDAGSAATRPALIVDNQSNLHISFVDLTTVYYSQVQVWNAPFAQSWLPRQSMNSKQTAYFSKVAIDSKNILHYVFTENTPSGACSNCYHVYYRQSTDTGATWSEPVDLVNDVVGAVKPQILIDKKDNIHVVWETGQGGGLGQLTDPTTVTYSASYDGGSSWSAPYTFPVLEKELAKNITIGLDQLDNLVIAWWSLPFDVILYSISEDQGRSWSIAEPIPNVWGAAGVYQSNLDNYSMVSDSLGNLHLVVVGRLGELQQSLNVLDLVWDGEEWAQPEIVATYTGDVPEWPRVAIGNGNQLNVVWFVRDEAHIWDSSSGRYRVWYSKGEASAPFINSLKVPTVTPTSAVTPTAIVDPTSLALNSTPVITLEPTVSISNMKPPENIPLNEMDYVELLAKALVPSMLFVVGIVVVAMVRKR